MNATRRGLIGLGLFGLLAVIWALGIAPSAGPDEPSHVIRSGALIRGQLDGDFVAPSITLYELPSHIGFPDPGCYAFDPSISASCATAFDAPDGDGRVLSTSASYPIWGHLVPGLGTLFPDGWSGPASRIFDAAIPVLLLVASLMAARRRGRLPMAALGFAITVPLWFTIVVVNPSGLVIAGGIALWIGLLSREPTGLSRLERSLVAVGWLVMVLPRRDGMVYAALIVVAALLITDRRLGDRWRQIGRAGQVAVVVPTAVMIVWGLGSSQASTKMLVLVPLLPVVVAAIRTSWGHIATTRGRSIGLAMAAAVAGVVGSFGVMSLRGDGFDSDILQAVISQSGTDLYEAIGLIGWLDTPVPQSMVFLWLIGLGVLGGAAVMVNDRRALFGAAAIVATSIWASWVLTMLQNDDDGLYWQGRYYLPFLVGVPLLLGHVGVDTGQARRIARFVTGIGLVVLTMGFGAAMRRWGVGVNGSMMPWRWDTYDTAVPPVMLLWLHVLVAGGIWWWLHDDSDGALTSPADGSSPADDEVPFGGVNIVGYHHVSSGLGSVARSMSAAIRRAGLPVVDVDIALTNSPQLRPPNPIPQHLHAVSVVVATAAELAVVLESMPTVIDTSDGVAGYWFWELGDVPADHVVAAGGVDEIWTPTTFVFQAYDAAISGCPVRLVPVPLPEPSADRHAIAAWRSRLMPHETRRRRGALFLVSLDLLSIVERKNPFDAIEAFRRAFDRTDPASSDRWEAARLVVKTINGDRVGVDLDRIMSAAGGDERILVIDEHVSPTDLDSLIAAADCYVSLHRSEGLGLHLAAAMWLGTPVISTNYGGNTDLMDAGSAALIDFDLVPVPLAAGPYPETSRWAAPDVDHAARWMRRMVDEPSVGAELATSARLKMETQLESGALAAAVTQLVERAARLDSDAIR